MRNLLSTAALAVAVLAGGCDVFTAPPIACDAPVEPGADWQEADVDVATFQLPPGMEFDPINEGNLRWAGSGLVLLVEVDSAGSSGPTAPHDCALETSTDAGVSTFELGGGGGYFVDAFWPDIGDGISLSVNGIADDPDGQAVLLGVVYSVRAVDSP